MEKVTVIDSLMGAGKTTYAIDRINKASPLERFIYVTPFIAEIERVIAAADKRHFVQPTNNVEGGRKLTSLKRLIEDGVDIATTHALFETADDELRDLLRANNYTLILDEVINVIDKAGVSPSDMRILLDKGFVEMECNRVVWTAKDHEYEYGVFDRIKLLAQAGTLFYHREKYLIYAFPPSIFETFSDVFVLTYLFDAQLMKYYFDLYSIPYELKAVCDGEIVPYDAKREPRAELLSLMDIYEGPLNDCGNTNTAFSGRWFQRRDKRDELTGIKSNMYTYIRSHAKAKAGEVLWTTLKARQHDLKGKGYTKGFLALNARATNEYADHSTLMYCYNRFMNPIETSFFQDNGLTVNETKLALSDMLQWIWRSQIRNSKPIKLYVPAKRMRELLYAWAKYEI